MSASASRNARRNGCSSIKWICVFMVSAAPKMIAASVIAEPSASVDMPVTP